jgi:V8-like Glu-specific endopeptidase
MSRAAPFQNLEFRVQSSDLKSRGSDLRFEILSAISASRSRALDAALLLVTIMPLVAAAQPSPPAYVILSYPLHSGLHDGSGEQSTVVFRSVIQASGTPWMQVYLADYNLGEASFITLTALANGDVQWHHAGTLAQWHNASGIFRGDRVLLELHAAPGDHGVFVQLSQIIIADPVSVPPADEPEDICGDNDDRVASNDARVGRLFFGGCTGWLVSNGAALTAGHCGTPDGNITGVMEFNVPMSMANGTPVPAAMNDQYPINQVIATESNGEGNDFNVYDLAPNSNTGLKAHVAQDFFRLTLQVPAEDEIIRVTGFGIDNTPPGPGGGPGGDCNGECNSSSLTQQTDTGPFVCLDGTDISHEVDTEPANSGSPIMYANGNWAFGIHTTGGCDDFFSGYDNGGTWLAYAPLFNALVNYLGPSTVMVDWFPSLGPVYFGTIFHPYGTLPEAVSGVPNGGTIAIISGTYPGAANTLTAGTGGKAMTLKALFGTATIGN